MVKEKILVIDDNADDYLIIERLIRDEYDVHYHEGIGDFISFLKECEPKCILLDYNLGSRLGTEILDIIQNEEDFADISVIMLTNEQDPNVVVKCIKYNAANYLIKDNLSKESLILAIKNAITETNLKIQTKIQQEEIMRLLYIDELTGVNNRRFFQEKMEEEIARCKRGMETFSLNIIDLDNFKNINDKYGHHVGDEVLKIVASTIKDSIRCTDYICRYGGDEFVLILVEMNKSNGEKFLQQHLDKCALLTASLKIKINDYIKQKDKIVFVEDNVDTYYTVSIGTALYDEDITDFSDLFRNSDKAMYSVKERGGNGVAFYEDSQYIAHGMTV